VQCTRVETFGHKICEWYQENPDCKLQYRSATLMPPDGPIGSTKGSTAAAVKMGNYPTLITDAGELPIVKMTEKYGRNEKVDAYEVRERGKDGLGGALAGCVGLGKRV
jgi:hypothetical protein